jgi:hypothetical protein
LASRPAFAAAWAYLPTWVPSDHFLSASIRWAAALRDDVPVQGAATVGAVNALLTVQEIGDPSAAERRRSLLHGHDVLDRLDELRHGLLAGTFPAGKLDELLRVVRIQHERAVDPQLRDVLREIELRASVELAKLGRLG